MQPLRAGSSVLAGQSSPRTGRFGREAGRLFQSLAQDSALPLHVRATLRQLPVALAGQWPDPTAQRLRRSLVRHVGAAFALSHGDPVELVLGVGAPPLAGLPAHILLMVVDDRAGDWRALAGQTRPLLWAAASQQAHPIRQTDKKRQPRSLLISPSLTRLWSRIAEAQADAEFSSEAGGELIGLLRAARKMAVRAPGSSSGPRARRPVRQQEQPLPIAPATHGKSAKSALSTARLPLRRMKKPSMRVRALARLGKVASGMIRAARSAVRASAHKVAVTASGRKQATKQVSRQRGNAATLSAPPSKMTPMPPMRLKKKPSMRMRALARLGRVVGGMMRVVVPMRLSQKSAPRRVFRRPHMPLARRPSVLRRVRAEARIRPVFLNRGLWRLSQMARTARVTRTASVASVPSHRPTAARRRVRVARYVKILVARGKLPVPAVSARRVASAQIIPLRPASVPGTAERSTPRIPMPPRPHRLMGASVPVVAPPMTALAAVSPAASSVLSHLAKAVAAPLAAAVALGGEALAALPVATITAANGAEPIPPPRSTPLMDTPPVEAPSAIPAQTPLTGESASALTGLALPVMADAPKDESSVALALDGTKVEPAPSLTPQAAPPAAAAPQELVTSEPTVPLADTLSDIPPIAEPIWTRPPEAAAAPILAYEPPSEPPPPASEMRDFIASLMIIAAPVEETKQEETPITRVWYGEPKKPFEDVNTGGKSRLRVRTHGNLSLDPPTDPNPVPRHTPEEAKPPVQPVSKIVLPPPVQPGEGGGYPQPHPSSPEEDFIPEKDKERSKDLICRPRQEKRPIDDRTSPPTSRAQSLRATLEGS